jgi:hypothetical protein
MRKYSNPESKLEYCMPRAPWIFERLTIDISADVETKVFEEANIYEADKTMSLNVHT